MGSGHSNKAHPHSHIFLVGLDCSTGRKVWGKKGLPKALWSRLGPLLWLFGWPEKADW